PRALGPVLRAAPRPRRDGPRRARPGRRPDGTRASHAPGRPDGRPEVARGPRRGAHPHPRARRTSGRSGGPVTRATLNQASGAKFSRIMGLGAVRGELVVTNDDIAGPID